MQTKYTKIVPRINLKTQDWPDSIEMPGRGEFARGTNFNVVTGKCCLGGWMRKSFLGGPNMATIGTSAARVCAMREFERVMNLVAEKHGFSGFVNLNDDKYTDDKLRAEVYRETAFLCEYSHIYNAK